MKRGRNPCIISIIWFHLSFIIVLWIMISFYLGIYPQQYLTLVCKFLYFLVLEFAYNSCKIRWSPLWVFILCFISISWFPLNFVSLPSKQKWVAEHIIGLICAELMLDNNAANNSLNKLLIIVYSWSLIDWTSWVSSVVLYMACLKALWFLVRASIISLFIYFCHYCVLGGRFQSSI